MIAPRRSFLAVLTLFFVAPLVAEYLLGDLPLKLLAALIVLAPAYGGAAILIREAARRTGRGWPTMLMLGAAYAVFSEGLVTQSLFNPDYLKMHMHLLRPAYVPALGIGGWWTLFMLNLHAFWSIGVSVALVEALFPSEADAPWLGWVGDAAIAAVFVLGTAANFAVGFKQNHFLAPTRQLLGAAVLSVFLVVVAFLLPVQRARRSGSLALNPCVAGGAAFVLGMAVLNTPPQWGWAAVGALLLVDTLFVVLVALALRKASWSALHNLGVAAGGALAYGIHAFAQKPLIGGVLGMRISNTVLLAAALSVAGLAARRVMRHQTATEV